MLLVVTNTRQHESFRLFALLAAGSTEINLWATIKYYSQGKFTNPGQRAWAKFVIMVEIALSGMALVAAFAAGGEAPDGAVLWFYQFGLPASIIFTIVAIVVMMLTGGEMRLFVKKKETDFEMAQIGMSNDLSRARAESEIAKAQQRASLTEASRYAAALVQRC